MIKINLLDWRAALRERRRQQFTVMFVIGLAFALAAVALGYTLMSSEVSYQQQRNEYLRQQIAEIDQKIKEIQELEKVKQNLLSRMRVIEELQSSRSATVHFFDEIVNTLPEGITLTLIKQVGDVVNIEGLAESNGRVSTYIKNLEASQWFDDPKLIVIKTSEKNRLRESAFSLQVKNLTKATQEDAAAAAAGTTTTTTTGTAGSNALGNLGSEPLPSATTTPAVTNSPPPPVPSPPPTSGSTPVPAPAGNAPASAIRGATPPRGTTGSGSAPVASTPLTPTPITPNAIGAPANVTSGTGTTGATSNTGGAVSGSSAAGSTANPNRTPAAAQPNPNATPAASQPNPNAAAPTAAGSRSGAASGNAPSNAPAAGGPSR